MRIYRITELEGGKVYIGATTKPLDHRIVRHFYAALVDEKHGALYDAMRTCGVRGFAWEVVEECDSVESMWDAERRHIAEHNCRVPFGYNQTPGGPGAGWQIGRKRGPMSEEERQKRSAALKVRKAWNKGIPHGYQARVKMRGRVPWNKGIPRTDAEKQRMRDAIAQSSAHGDNHPKCKPIECDGVVYESVRDMERRTGLSRAGIYYRLSKGRARFT